MFAVQVAISMIVSSAVTDDLPATRNPTSKWVVNYAENMCSLERQYGTATNRLMLAVRPYPMRDEVALYILDAPARLKGDYVPTEISFGSGLPTVETKMETFDVPGQKVRYNYIELKRAELERAVATEMISFRANERMSLSLKVAGLRKALTALDECVVDLLVEWGFSRERQQMQAKRAEMVKPFQSYISNNDYPSAALRAGETGANSARFTIDQNGRVASCTIVETSRSMELDAAICRVSKRFRFRPAIDNAGRPMESIGFFRLRWMIPS